MINELVVEVVPCRLALQFESERECDGVRLLLGVKERPTDRADDERADDERADDEHHEPGADERVQVQLDHT